MIRIDQSLTIDERDIRFTYARSPGPGGQNVNKTATKVTLLFDVEHSGKLSAEQKARLRKVLATRINKEGVLQVVRSRHRTQVANRRDAREAFASLLADALRHRLPRKKTKPTRAARERRLEEKGRRSRLKQQRRLRHSGEDGDQ